MRTLMTTAVTLKSLQKYVPVLQKRSKTRFWLSATASSNGDQTTTATGTGNHTFLHIAQRICA